MLINNIEHFKSAENSIWMMNKLRLSCAVFGLFTLVAPILDIKGDWSPFLEWYAFLGTFVSYMLLSNVIRFTDKFVFEKQN